MIKIIHLITGLNTGGAEMMLYKLLSNMNRQKFDNIVVSMMDKGDLGDDICALGIKVYTLGMKRGVPCLASIYALKKVVKEEKPDILQTWMYHADFLGLIMKFLHPKMKLVWGIRQAEINVSKDKKSTMYIAKINARMSFASSAIICNSIEGIRCHSLLGYPEEKFIYIPNGIDFERFRCSVKPSVLVDEGYISTTDNRKIICTVGRWDIQKGYNYLLEALSLLSNVYPKVILVLCGAGLDSQNSELRALIHMYNIADKLVLLGKRSDVPDILVCADFYISSSIGEGFSNAIAEAMACALPVITTDVGDSARIVGQYGIVVPAKDVKSLASAMIQYLESSEADIKKIGADARRYVQKNFSIGQTVSEYERVYCHLGAKS